MDVEIRSEEFGAAAQRLVDAWDRELADQGLIIDPEAGSTTGPADFAPPRGQFLVAYGGGEPVACAGLRPIEESTGEVKRLYIDAGWRRQGIGRALMRRLEEEARSLGYRRLRLDTNPGNEASRALFLAAGFHEIPDYNGNELAAYWFEKEL